MKTEKEIKEYIEHIRDSYVACQCVDAELHNIEWVYNVLEWIMEVPEPKRTIFDLSQDELKELLLLTIGDGGFIDITKSNVFKSYNNIKFCTLEEICDSSYNIEFTISDNLDFSLYRNGKTWNIQNQIKLHTRLQEMLNEEVK